MAIISASRKTDIPTYFSDWFLNCLDKGEFYIRPNPYNQNLVTHLTFEKEDIDCIVFWTKNPIPMMNKLDRLDGYNYYFQFTLTGYKEDIEGNLPNKSILIDAFKELSRKTQGKVVWRYDPIIIDFSYTMDWHLGEFSRIARELDGYTTRCVISFVDLYKHLSNYKDVNTIIEDYKSKQNFINFCKELARIAHMHNMDIYTCAEELTKSDIGIERGACIDKELIEKITGYELKVSKDKGQRSACLCAESVDIGKYDTCNNRCQYCYACKDRDSIIKNFSLYDPDSSFLCDRLTDSDIVTEKKLQSLRKYDWTQLSLF